MKSVVIFISLFCLIALNSCDNDETNAELTSQGVVNFSVSVVDSIIDLKSTDCDDDLSKISAALVSIENEGGESVYELKKIAFYKFNEEYISEPISLKIGLYKLTKFLIIDSSDSVLYASPIENSDKAYSVKNLLPIEFIIKKEEVTKVIPEVISAEGSTPEDFGYISFSFEIMDSTISFYLGVLVYNSSINNYEMIDAELIITHDTDTLFNKHIDAVTNNISIKHIYDNYEITISKPGYNTYNKLFTAYSLEYYNNTPLLVLLEKESEPANKPVAYYPFNGNANDMSGNNNNGIVHGATQVPDRKGNPNSAYYFDGINDYISIPSSSSLNPLHQLTLALWLNIDTITNRYTPVIHKGGTHTEGFANREYLIFIEDIVRIYAESAGDNSTHHFTGCDFPGVKTWFHFTAVFDRIEHKMRLYINGDKVKEAYDSYSTFNNNNDSLKIATWEEIHYQYAEYFKGYIDDVCIYNCALSDSEIIDIFSQ